jgi:hypothetical protein
MDVIARPASSGPAEGVLEARVPVLNPWVGVAVLALHSHTADEPCDDRCSVYDLDSES